MRLLGRLFLLVALWVSVPGAALAAEAATIDAVEIRGDQSLERELVESALGVKTGKTLSRDELDQRLSEAERRLMALGYFKSVDFQLERGTQRGHYRIIVRLVALSASYVGTDDGARTQRYTSYGQALDEHADHEEVFGGTRDIAGTGARFEISGYQDRTHDVYGAGGDNADTTRSGRGIALWPDIGGTPFLAWAMEQYQDERSDDRYSYAAPGYQGSSETTSGSWSVFHLVGAGARYGLVTASLLGGRGAYGYHGQSRTTFNGTASDSPLALHAWISLYGAELTYSEKTGLAAVEPGTVARVIASRSLSPGLSAGPSYQAALERTEIVGGRHAFTPDLYYSFDRQNNSNGTTVVDVLTRTYDVGLAYEYVLPGNLIIGLERAVVGVIDAHQDGYPAQRTSLSLRYVSPNIIASLHFTWGPEAQNDLAEPFQGSRLGLP